MLQNTPDNDNFLILYNVLVPEVFCLDLVRIGTVGDGGKWICNPLSLLEFPSCVIFSLGIRNDPSFDESIQTLLNLHCELISVDQSKQKADTLNRLKKVNGKFMQAFVADKTDEIKNHYTLKDIMDKNDHTSIDILKIDIEGSEYKVADEMLSIPICQILIEAHSNSSQKHYELLNKISQHNFYLYSYEINGKYHYLSEYSFIHKDCLEKFNVNTIYGKYLSID